MDVTRSTLDMHGIQGVMDITINIVMQVTGVTCTERHK